MEAISHSTKILVVDDEESICISLRRKLSKEGFRVNTATTASEALQIARQEEIGVAIIDRILEQGANGIDLIAELKQIHPYCQTIMISGQPSFESAAATMRYQTFAYLTKPFRIDLLSTTVHEAAEEYRKHKQQGLQQAMFTSLFEATPVPAVLCDESGSVLFSNPSFSKTFGYAQDEVTGKSLLSMVSIPEEIFQKTLARTLRGETIPEFEATLTTRDGRQCDVELNISLCQNPAAQFRGLWFILRDITTVKRLREEVLQTEKLSLLGSMSAKIVHQISNPTQVLIGYLDLLRESKDISEAVRKNITIMYEAAQMIKRLTGEFLNLARPCPRTITTFQPEAPLDKAADFLLQTGQINQCKIIKMYDDNAPPVQGDLQQLTQVFINLLVNAVHAMEGNSEKLLFLMTKRQADGTVSVIVKDNGCGIAPDLHEKIFEHFFTTRQGRGGTGLGLPLVKSIVEWHRGTVRVESDPGAGAAFIVTLPGLAGESAAVQAA